MLFSHMQESDLLDQAAGSIYKRFTIDLVDNTVQYEDLVVMDNGIIDLPRHNPGWDKKEYCFSYLTENFGDKVFDENYSFPVVKYDHCKKQMVAKWGEGMFAAQEVQFIPDPKGTSEEDGLLLVVGYRMLNMETALFFIDPKTMTTVQEYATPFPLPMAFHASYWPGAEF